MANIEPWIQLENHAWDLVTGHLDRVTGHHELVSGAHASPGIYGRAGESTGRPAVCAASRSRLS